jgi:hypothetical protein
VIAGTKQNRRHRTPAFIGFACTALLGSCSFSIGYYADQEAAATASVARLRQLYNSQMFAKACEMVAAGSSERCVSDARRSFDEFGAYLGTSDVLAMCIPYQVELLYLSKYEKGDAMERMVWSVRDGKTVLIQYGIQHGHKDIPHVDEKLKCTKSA